MAIKSYVQFVATDAGGGCYPETEFTDIDSLQAYVQKTYEQHPISFRLTINRYICTQDTDKPKQKPKRDFNGHFECFVYNNIWEPSDTPNTFQICEQWTDLNTNGIYTPRPKCPTLYHIPASYPLTKNGERETSPKPIIRPLTFKDLIIDTNLIQIWPLNENYGTMPMALAYLLLKQPINEA